MNKVKSVKTSLEPGAPPSCAHSWVSLPLPSSPCTFSPLGMCGAGMGRSPGRGELLGDGLCLSWHLLALAVPFSPHLALPGGASPQFCIKSWPFLLPSLSYWVLLTLPLPPLHLHFSWIQRGRQQEEDRQGLLSVSLVLRHREIGPKGLSF